MFVMISTGINLNIIPALPLFFSTDGSLLTLDHVEVQISNVPIPPSLSQVVNFLNL